MTDAHLNQVLDEQACWTRLANAEFGRLAYHLADEVHIAPVNYAVREGSIFFRTAEGSKLLGVVMNEDVAFEIDHIVDDEEVAWSVVARGKARILEGDAARQADHLRLRPWVDNHRYNVVAIAVDEITGREYHLARPWRHILPQERG
ncbi:pyridoxamine 5'-phosphate oxidase family protein [Ornithinimicrobium pratense]|uniref:Pyridoxamine 5'-phosphate oxidase family protein n=1 Tax=Ornithinimicrobium pratense TaxID=2593973 RepID=A0A5J6V754_9MICO|nr:pyridoxamine 5'-phosphate oxidase family protein [Ornithinimicrobium pratense]QFG69880.1 pyridoxamine 5'-phosphate oxidase family protein [Ornithinimicrobium pratense]